MRTRFTHQMILAALVAMAAQAQGVKIKVTNPSTEARQREPVVVSWPDVGGMLGKSEMQKLRLIDEKGRSIAFQVDDLEGDGMLDELTFQADLAPGASTVFLLTAEADTLSPPIGPLRTDAQNLKKVEGEARFLDDDDGPGSLRSESRYPFDGVGWESELIGYRLYLDERNAIDIQGKRAPGLHWKFIGSSGVNYQLDSYWGMDVLHVGPSVGFGGVAFWAGDSVCKPNTLDRRRTRVLARGPVRTVVRVDYDGWDVAGAKKNLTSIFLQYAGDRAFEHRVVLRSAGSELAATGIVRHEKGSVQWNSSRHFLSSFGPQARSGDGLFMVMAFEPSSVTKQFRGPFDDLVLLRLESGKPVRILLAAGWEGEEQVGPLEGALDTQRKRLVERISAEPEVQLEKIQPVK